MLHRSTGSVLSVVEIESGRLSFRAAGDQTFFVALLGNTEAYASLLHDVDSGGLFCEGRGRQIDSSTCERQAKCGNHVQFSVRRLDAEVVTYTLQNPRLWSWL